MLQRLNKDLLIKLIENINDPTTLGVEELKNRMVIYEQIIKEREMKERIEDVKRLVWELRNVEQFKELIETNKEEIEKLDFDFSDINTELFKKRNDEWRLTKIFYKGQFSTFKELLSSCFKDDDEEESQDNDEMLFSLGYVDEGGFHLFWKQLIYYLHGDKWDFYLSMRKTKNIESINCCYESLDWEKY